MDKDENGLETNGLMAIEGSKGKKNCFNRENWRWKHWKPWSTRCKILSWVRNSQTLVEIERSVETSQHKVKLLHRSVISRGIAYRLSLQTYMTQVKDYQLAFEHERWWYYFEETQVVTSWNRVHKRKIIRFSSEDKHR